LILEQQLDAGDEVLADLRQVKAGGIDRGRAVGQSLRLREQLVGE
jgi:hypothetical protein